MSTLNRDKALAVLLRAGHDTWSAASVLNALEECVSPDGYTEDEYGDLLRRTGLLDQKLAAVAALCDKAEVRKPHEGHWHYIGTPAIRAILKGSTA